MASITRRRSNQPLNRSLSRTRMLALTLPLVLAAFIPTLAGCEKEEVPIEVAPPRQFAGPEYLYGTIGSMTLPRGFEPKLVGGYGLVVNLDGTGSSEVPTWLRPNLENTMRARGVGSARLNMQHLDARVVLDDPNTAVVSIKGLVPPGAVKGTRFDVIVEALEGTQTTSLQGGRLWSFDLSQGGLNRRGAYIRRDARAMGDLMINPFAEDAQDAERFELRRRGVILSGGMVTRDQQLELVLNQPNFNRSRAIANRINERFPRSPQDREETANARSEAVIRLNVPARYAANPARFMKLIQYTYVHTAPGFEPAMARELGGALVADPEQRAQAVALAWESLGRTALSEIRVYYDHTNLDVRLAALEAGVRLGDDAAAPPVIQLASHTDPNRRIQAAVLLGMAYTARGADAALRQLLDDDDKAVRIAAYESLAAAGSPLVKWVHFGEGAEGKFRLDLVESDKPLIYISQVRVPRIVIFGPNTGFRSPVLAQMWDNHLMLRELDEADYLRVFYQPYGQVEAEQFTIAPTVANLIYLLGHRPTLRRPADGLDLTYSEVANAIYLLRKQGLIEADVEVQLSPIAAAVAVHEQRAGGIHREYDATPLPTPVEDGQPGDQSPAALPQPGPDAVPAPVAPTQPGYGDLPLPAIPGNQTNQAGPAPQPASGVRDLPDLPDLPEAQDPAPVDAYQPQPADPPQPGRWDAPADLPLPGEAPLPAEANPEDQ